MFSLLLETCLLSVVLVMIQGTSLICEQHCQDPSNRDYPYAIPGCNCSHHPINKSISASVPIKKLSPDRTDISVKELIGKEKAMLLDLPKIYYVVNPKKIDITITKRQQGHISHPKVQSINHEHNDSNLKTRMQLLVQQNRPLYLDIGLQEKSDKSGKNKELELSEDSLSDCLDLNILIYSRKNNSSTTTKKVYNRDMLKKYENLSDPDLILAIKSKCSKPQNVVSKSLTEVRGSQVRNDFKNKSNKQTTGFHANAPSTQSDALALLPTDTNRQDYELREIKEKTDAAAHSQVNKSEFDITKPFIDILDETNKEQPSENRNSEGPDASLDYDSSAQYPYSGVETSTEDEHNMINDDNKSENTRFHDKSNSKIEVTDKDINTSPTEYVYVNHDQISQNSELENNYKPTNEYAQNIEEFVTPTKYVAKTHFDLENRGTNKEIVTEKNDVSHENDCLRGSLSTNNFNKEPSPNKNENYSNTLNTSTKAPFSNSSKLLDIPDTEDERKLNTTIPLLETDTKYLSTPSESREGVKSNTDSNDIHHASGYHNDVTTHSPNSIIDVNEFVSNTSVSPNTANPLNASGTFHEYKNFGNHRMHIQNQTENFNNETTSNINQNTILNPNLGYSGFEDDKTERINFAKDLSSNFTISKGQLEDKSEELYNNIHSNLSEDNLNHNGRPIETTNDSKNLHAIVSESLKITPGLKSESQRNIEEYSQKDLNANLGYSGFEDDKTERINFAKDLSSNFTISKGQLEDKSEELYNNIHSNLSEDNLNQNGRPIETTNDSKNLHAIVSESLTITPGLKSESQRNIEEYSQKDVSSETIPREQYSEYEIKIPKIISTELENGTVESHVDGYEVPPKHDFVPDEDIGATAEVHFKTQAESDISGHMYFVFGKVAIPAKFIQNSRGTVRLGLDGFSLCRYWLINHPQSDFLAKLCKSQKQSV